MPQDSITASLRYNINDGVNIYKNQPVHLNLFNMVDVRDTNGSTIWDYQSTQPSYDGNGSHLSGEKILRVVADNRNYYGGYQDYGLNDTLVRVLSEGGFTSILPYKYLSRVSINDFTDSYTFDIKGIEFSSLYSGEPDSFGELDETSNLNWRPYRINGFHTWNDLVPVTVSLVNVNLSFSDNFKSKNTVYNYIKLYIISSTELNHSDIIFVV